MPEPNSYKRSPGPAKERYRHYSSRSRTNWFGSPAPEKHSYKHSISGSLSPHYRRSRRRSPSRSPHKRVTHGNRENPQKSRCIGIFGLNISTNERDIRDIFEKFGSIERVNLVIDAKSGQSRGFCFVYFENLHDAKSAREHCCGMEIDGRRIRVDYSITSRAHTPTPGVFRGRSTHSRGDHQPYRRRTPPSPHYRDRERRRPTIPSRSRSRSYFPRRR